MNVTYNQGMAPVPGHTHSSSYAYPPTSYSNYHQQQHRPTQSYYQPTVAQQQQAAHGHGHGVHLRPLAVPVNHVADVQPAPQVPAPHMAQEQASVNGGINSILEYNLNQMSSFLAWCAFGMLKQARSPSKDFENLVSSVLFATRLPKSSIIIALEYMNQRFSSKKIKPTMTEHEIFNFLVVGLVLANKFNDDNTFTNKSWCGATGLQLIILNNTEKEWLEDVKWSLSVVNFESNILTLEECWKTWVEKYGEATSTTSSSSSSSSLSSSAAASTAASIDPIYTQNSITPTISPSSTFYSNQSATSANRYSYQPSYVSMSSSPIYEQQEVRYTAPVPVQPSLPPYPSLSSPVSYENDWGYKAYADLAIQYVGTAPINQYQPLHPHSNTYHHHPTHPSHQPPPPPPPPPQHHHRHHHHHQPPPPPPHHQPGALSFSGHPSKFVGYANPYFMAY
ncbi:uncharacterized protein LODBEIA_P17500 [Lodderomyces beijingensis]|uniref:Cyclin N-terminal domain-containing protein n=1 Tax=Lodderomyces beijingensis TaxID=1775926 RepID=A0ABP0ZH91_9ASCO